MKIQDLSTGEIIDANDAELPSLALAGRVAIPAGEYEFENQLGERIRVPAEEFRQAVEANFKYIDEATKNEERLQKEYGDSPLRSIAEGATRSLTLGVSDQILPKIGIDVEGLAERRRRNPISSAIGEGLGIVAPILATGGAAGAARGVGSKILEKTAAGQVAKVAATAGKGAGSLVKNEIAKGAVSLGVEGAIEGALLGVGKTISEDALGDTEFAAESLMANVGTGALTGAGFGAALGATGAVVSKLGRGAIDKLKTKAIDELDLTAHEKSILRAQMDAEKSLQALGEKFENPELKQAIEELGFKTPPTIGVLSPSLTTKRLESSLAASPSLPGLAVGGSLNKFVTEAQEKAAGLFEKAKETTPFELGNRARQQIMGGVSEKLRPAQDALKRIYDDLGESPVSERSLKLLKTRLQKSDVSALGLDRGLAKRIDDVLPELNTLNRVNMFKKGIGKELAMAYRNGDLNSAELLSDVYDTLKRVEKRAITDAAMAAGPKRGPKLAEAYGKAFEESMEAYRAIYREYQPLAEQLGTKLKRPDDFLDWVESVEAEKLGSRLIDLKDFESAKKLNKDFPELFDIARSRKLADKLKSVTGKDGAISFDKFTTMIGKMDKEERQILFGFDQGAQKRLDNIVKVMRQIPQPINPSGTSINQTFLDIINPLFQGKELLRYALYRGGDSAIRQYLLKTVPVVTEAERQVNRTKSSISSAVNGFFRSSTPSIAIGVLSVRDDDKKMANAKKVYEQIQQNPEAFIDRFIVKNKELLEAAPNTGMALQSRLMAGMRFLQSKVPSSQTEYLAHQYTPSRSELLGFQEYVEAIEKPLSVLDMMKRGYISPRHIEALKVVYPKLYNSIQDDLAAKMPKKLSKTQKTMLQQILGVKVSPTADYLSLQSVMIPQPMLESGKKMTAAKAKNLDAGSRSQSGLDKTLYRN